MNILRTYTDRKLSDDYEKLIEKGGVKLLRNNLGYKCSNVFFQHERFNTPSQCKPSMFEFWANNKVKILKYAKNYTKGDLHSCIQFLGHPPSQFPPNVAMWFYKEFNVKTVFDPFAGWGDRCIAAMAAGVNYIGVDSNKELALPYSEMINFYPHRGKIKFINKPVETVNINNLTFDFVLSSPPFWNTKGTSLLEEYNHQTERDYTSFMDKILVPLIRNCKRKAPVCLYISDSMADYLYEKNIKAQDIYSYKSSGNKKMQQYNIYCY